MRKTRKVLAILLCLVMCLTMLPTWALAEETEQAELTSEEPAGEAVEEQQPKEAAAPAPEEAAPQEEIQEAEEPEPAYEEPDYEEPAYEEEPEQAEPETFDAPPAEEEGAGQQWEPAASEEPTSIPEEGDTPVADGTEASTDADAPTVKVLVVFRISPEDAEPFVYTKDNPDDPEEKIEVEPEEDGSYLLLPGEYYYTLTAEGYVPMEEEELTVEASEEPVEVEAVMTPADVQTAEEQIEEPEEEAALQAEASPGETAELMASSGTCGDNLTWTLDDEGTLTISGTGPMTDYFYDTSPWSSSRTRIKEVLITEGVTSIGNYAFYYCSNLTSVTAPESVTRIGYHAFYNCSNLTSVTIPESVTRIESGAFYNCSSLTTVTIPDGVTSIGGYAFYNCSSLTSVTIPEGVTSIEESTFYNCSSLTSVTIPESVTSIGHNAFSDCSRLTSVTIPEGVSTIDNSAFSGCSCLTSVTIPESVTSIAYNAFSGCDNLTTAGPIGSSCNIQFGWSDRIPNSAFSPFSSLTSVTIPEGVTSIGEYAFSGCSSLTSVTIPEGVTSIEEYAFSGCSNLTSVTIPEGVTSIESYAFYHCSSLTNVTIPESVTSIAYNAFSGCDNLTTAGPIGSGCNIQFGWTDKIPNSAFSSFSSLTSVIIPEGVTSIGEYAFSGCSNLTSVTIPENVTNIGRYAFYNCSSLTSVTIPESVTSIGEYAFSGCSNLTTAGPIGSDCNIVFGWSDKIPDSAFSPFKSLISVTIPEGVTSIGGYAFYNCSNLTSVTIPESVTSIGSYAFYQCSNLTSVTIPDGVTSIEYQTFGYCENLTTVTIPVSVRYCDYTAFEGSDRITEVYYGGDEGSRNYVFGSILSDATWHYAELEEGWSFWGNALLWHYDSSTRTLYIKGTGAMWDWGEYYYYGPDENTRAPWSEYAGRLVKIEMEPGITAIGNYAFCSLTKLSSVSIPDSVTRIGSCSFSGCTQIKNINLPQSVTEIGGSAFSGCSSLTGIAIPSGVTKLEGNVFYNCSGLESVTIPEGVTEIGDRAFCYCRSLTEIMIPSGITAIGDSAFSGCSSLMTVTLPSGITEISRGLFSSCNLKSVAIPSGVTSIGEYAFAWNDGLKSITIPESVTTIGSEAFEYCDNLTAISFPSNPPEIDSDAFSGVTANAYYPAAGNWWEEDLLGYGGDLTWIAVGNSSVHYDLMGGSGNIPDQQKTYGIPLTLSLLIPTKTNCSFLGWAESPNATEAVYQPGDLFSGEGAVTLYAVWDQIVEINATNFPDSAFRSMVSGFDLDSDGILSQNEMNRISSINCSSRKIKTLKGIEYFPNLRYLWCQDNELTELDVSSNPELITLNCGASQSDGTILGNKLTSLDISKNTKLQNLHCQYNQIRSLDVSNNPDLVYINCANNQISSLDLSRNLNLQTLFCGNNRLTGLDVRVNTELRSLECYQNQLSSLDVSRNRKLQRLHLATNKIGTLNVSNNNALTFLSCSGNQLKNLDLSACGELTGLNCNNNQLSSLDLTYNTKLQWLSAYSNRLTALDLRDCPQLTNIVRNGPRAEYNNHTVVEYNLGGGGAFVNFDKIVSILPTIFSDNGDPDAYYHDPIYWAVDNGITTGRTATTFDPYGKCTRGHIVLFLWRAMGMQEPTVSNPFTDVKESDGFYKAVLWAVESGITTGQTATTFGPWNYCTRGQIVTFLWRAMGKPEPTGSNPFTDVKESDGFYKAVLWAVESGITTGRTTTTFDPWATCTRGQAVTFLYRAMHG